MASSKSLPSLRQPRSAPRRRQRGSRRSSASDSPHVGCGAGVSTMSTERRHMRPTTRPRRRASQRRPIAASTSPPQFPRAPLTPANPRPGAAGPCCIASPQPGSGTPRAVGGQVGGQASQRRRAVPYRAARPRPRRKADMFLAAVPQARAVERGAALPAGPLRALTARAADQARYPGDVCSETRLIFAVASLVTTVTDVASKRP